MTRALILLGITALACHDKEAPKRLTPGSAAPPPVPTAPAPKALDPDNGPALPNSLPAEGSGTPSDRFGAQEIDTAWKSRTEGELRRRYAKMKHAPAETECRLDMCQLTITGSPEDQQATIDELESLHDMPARMLLTRPTPDKTLAYLQFER